MKNLRVLLYILVVNFILLFSMIFIPEVREVTLGTKLYFLPLFTYTALGIILLILTLRSKAKRNEKRAFLLASMGAILFFTSILLHNGFDEIVWMTRSIPFVPEFFEFFVIIFFYSAIFLSPLLFLSGVITHTVMTIRSK